METLADTSHTIDTMPLREITQTKGEQGLLDRLEHELDQTDWNEDLRNQIELAKNIALAAHEGVSRGDHPYSTHVLRTTIRTMSPDHIAVPDPELIIAALLHDTVEDYPEIYQHLLPIAPGLDARQHAFCVITELFGERVALTVQRVTNPIRRDTIVTTDEKHEFYRGHVRSTLVQALADDEASGILKLSDFIDNCAGLPHNENPRLAAKLAAKYKPLIPDLINFVQQSHSIPSGRKDHLIRQLERADQRCDHRLGKHALDLALM